MLATADWIPYSLEVRRIYFLHFLKSYTCINYRWL